MRYYEINFQIQVRVKSINVSINPLILLTRNIGEISYLRNLSGKHS